MSSKRMLLIEDDFDVAEMLLMYFQSLSVPRSCGTEPEGPPTTAAEVAQTFRQSLQKNHQERSGPFVHIIP